MMNKKIKLPDYENCLTNLACSIEKHFALEFHHKTLNRVDMLLNNNNSKNVIVLVYDGFGKNIIEKNLDQSSFFRKNLKDEITSVFPPTTAAATTSLITGLNPNEHGWLGWDVYFKKINKIVSIFENHEKDDPMKVFDYNVVQKFLKYESIVDRINKKGKFKAYNLVPFGENKYDSLDDMIDKLIKICSTNEKKYIYAYCNEPDHTLHRNGTNGDKTKSIVQEIDTKTKRLIEKIKDYTLIIVADHGHHDCNVITLVNDYPDFVELLEKNVAIEGRACTFWVKPNKDKIFRDKFSEYFGDDFILLSKKEVLEQKIFGNGNNHSELNTSLGDYLAIAIGNRYFEYYYYEDDMISHHAGITTEEMIVPLVIISDKDSK